MTSLDLPLDLLRARRNSKWNRYGADVIGAWVAEMDFEPAPAIQAVMERTVAQRDYGYPYRGEGMAETIVAEAFARRMKARFDWTVDPLLVQAITDLVQGTIATVLAFTDPGDSVLLQTPCYPPFRVAITEAGRRIVEVPLRDDGTRFALDPDALNKALAEKPRLFLLCNPQNPTGRVFGRDELQGIADVCLAHDMVIFSDEIHSDLVYGGGRHIPIATLSPAVARRTVTATSATKSFNIPGLRCGVLHFGHGDLRSRFHQRVPHILLGRPSNLGLDATVAAWDESQPWLDGVLAHLQTARDRIVDRVAASMPGIRFYAPEATYLAWMDCGGLDLPVPAQEFFLKHAGVAFSAGETFSPDCPQWLRFNFATSLPILDRILDAMEAAVTQKARTA